MKKYFENASSVERRFITATFLVLFLALNWIFVWPLFSDWSKVQARREKAQRTLEKFQKTIAQTTTLKSKVEKLEGEGMEVPPEDQVVKFMTTIQSQAAASGVTILTSVSQAPRTNQFFLERAQALTLAAREEQLVDFLYKLGTGDSLVRVRGLSLRPDPPKYALSANLTLVANYKKKIAARSAAPPPTTPPAPTVKAAPAPTTKPAAAPVTKPAPVPAAKPSSAPAPASGEKQKSSLPAKSDKPAAPGTSKPPTPNQK
jgi:type II secretory pathway component PulM